MKHEQILFNIDGLPIRVTKEIRLHEQLSVIPLHMHDELEILVGWQGKLQVDARGEQITLGEGDVAIIGQRIPHSTQKLLPYTAYLLLQFRPDSSPDTPHYLSLLTANRDRPLIRLPADTPFAKEIRRLISEIRAENMERGASYRYFIRGHISLLLGTLYRSGILSDPTLRTDNAALERLRPVLSYIDKAYGSELALDALAETVHLTPQYFCRLFKQTTGLSPIEYINRVRIFQSEQLLLSTDATVTEIALEVGFSQVSYFNRIFHRYKGMTPSEYRKVIYSQNKLM